MKTANAIAGLTLVTVLGTTGMVWFLLSAFPGGKCKVEVVEWKREKGCLFTAEAGVREGRMRGGTCVVSTQGE